MLGNLRMTLQYSRFRIIKKRLSSGVLYFCTIIFGSSPDSLTACSVVENRKVDWHTNTQKRLTKGFFVAAHTWHRFDTRKWADNNKIPNLKFTSICSPTKPKPVKNYMQKIGVFDIETDKYNDYLQIWFCANGNSCSCCASLMCTDLLLHWHGHHTYQFHLLFWH